jgi:hypothetical protein
MGPKELRVSRGLRVFRDLRATEDLQALLQDLLGSRDWGILDLKDLLEVEEAVEES